MLASLQCMTVMEEVFVRTICTIIFIRSKFNWSRLLEDPNLFQNPSIAIKKAVTEADTYVLNAHLNSPHNQELLRSGSCFNCVLIIDDMCYVANIGDSRCLLSREMGNKLYVLSWDHKPNDPDEIIWIGNAGGDVYVSAIKQATTA